MFIYVYMYIQLHCKPKFISCVGLSWFKMACFTTNANKNSQQDYISQHATFKQLEATGWQLSEPGTADTTIHVFFYLFSFNYCDEWQGINYTIQQNDTESTYKKRTFFPFFFFFKCKDVNSFQSANSKIKTLRSDPHGEENKVALAHWTTQISSYLNMTQINTFLERI